MKKIPSIGLLTTLLLLGIFFFNFPVKAEPFATSSDTVIITPATYVCTGSPLSCTNYQTENDCNNHTGCSWSGNDTCIGSIDCHFYDYDETNCNLWITYGCEFNIGTYECLGGFACSNLASNPDDCSTIQSQYQGYNNCAWSAQTCSGNPAGCSSYNQTNCNYYGCSWSVNTPTSTSATTTAYYLTDLAKDFLNSQNQLFIVFSSIIIGLIIALIVLTIFV